MVLRRMLPSSEKAVFVFTVQRFWLCPIHSTTSNSDPESTGLPAHYEAAAHHHRQAAYHRPRGEEEEARHHAEQPRAQPNARAT
jgi:hypothetical protein